MKGRVAIVSLRFNPAFIQHLIAYVRAAQELGYDAGLILDPAYRRFPELNDLTPYYEDGGTARKNFWTHVVFLNVAVENRGLAVTLKKQAAKIFYVYHEPWQLTFDYIKMEGMAATLRAALAHRATIPLLRLADKVILESECGVSAYQNNDVRYNPRYVHFPQIYDDEAPLEIARPSSQKRYFGFLGALCRSHGFDQYVSFMRFALQSGTKFEFLIASRFPLPASILADPIISNNKDKIEIRCGRPLTNQEMNSCYASCFGVWNLYRRSTQSGVLPKAFMYGTPVIASRLGSFPEYVEDGVNGRFADAENPRQVLNAIEELRVDKAEYARGCRESFLRLFFYRSRLQDLTSIFES